MKSLHALKCFEIIRNIILLSKIYSNYQVAKLLTNYGYDIFLKNYAVKIATKPAKSGKYLVFEKNEIYITVINAKFPLFIKLFLKNYF